MIHGPRLSRSSGTRPYSEYCPIKDTFEHHAFQMNQCTYSARLLIVTPYPAMRCEYYPLARALAQNHVIAWNTLMQSANMRGSGLETLGGFNPDRIAVFGDLEDVKEISHHHSMISTLTRLCNFMPAAPKIVRRASAVRPCRPITSPTSSGWTLSSSMITCC